LQKHLRFFVLRVDVQGLYKDDFGCLAILLLLVFGAGLFEQPTSVVQVLSNIGSNRGVQHLRF
jgi:hypothetical protein